MSGAEQFDPAFVQNVQRENAQFFEMAMRMGVSAIALEYRGRMLNFTYDKVKKMFKPNTDISEQEAQQLGSADCHGSLRSTKRALGFTDIELTPEQVRQQQQQQQVEPQPRPQQGPVARQRAQIEAGQKMLLEFLQ